MATKYNVVYLDDGKWRITAKQKGQYLLWKRDSNGHISLGSYDVLPMDLRPEEEQEHLKEEMLLCEALVFLGDVVKWLMKQADCASNNRERTKFWNMLTDLTYMMLR